MKTTKKTKTNHASIEANTHPEGEKTMKNETATPAYLAACTSFLDEFEATFPKTDPLTVTDKRRMAKARKGGERYTPHLVALAKLHGVSIRSLPLDTLQNASTEAQQLVPLQQQMERLMARLSARMFTAQSVAWGGSTKLYAVLKRLSKDDGELQTGLQPIEQFFNHRHPLVAREHPKTKKGKAALAAKKAAEQASASQPTVDAPAPEVTTDKPSPSSSPSPSPVSTASTPANGAPAPN